MSAKGKKKKSGLMDMTQSPMDFFKQGFDKPFTPFPSQHFNPALHSASPMNGYMNSNMNSFANSANGFMTPAHNTGHASFGTGLTSNFPLGSMSNSNFSNNPSINNTLQTPYSSIQGASGLNLTSNSGIVGALA